MTPTTQEMIAAAQAQLDALKAQQATERAQKRAEVIAEIHRILTAAEMTVDDFKRAIRAEEAAEKAAKESTPAV